ncbi:hypothetical protein ACQKFK_17885, partial [Bacillus mycoides]|uniref:hypothetical protein n=1 Tax=Bacillus mycoides TaxID=1405 RepID=UPI003D012872
MRIIYGHVLLFFQLLNNVGVMKNKAEIDVGGDGLSDQPNKSGNVDENLMAVHQLEIPKYMSETLASLHQLEIPKYMSETLASLHQLEIPKYMSETLASLHQLEIPKYMSET